MPGWNEYPVAGVFVGDHDVPVLVDNDVNIMALGECRRCWRGTVEDLLFVKVGTGIGAGLIIGGRLQHGARGGAGDIGHIRVAGVDDVVCPCSIGGFFDWGHDIDYRVVVRDREDGDVDCGAVHLSTSLGHNEHAHPMDLFSGCEGTFSTPASTGHGAADNLWWGFSARYTDRGAGDVPTLTGETQSQLYPKRRQAQHRTSGEGVSTQSAQDPAEGGGQRLTSINHGDWVAFDPVNLLNIDAIRFRVASAGPGGNIEVRRDAPDGELIATAAVPDTGANNNWTDVVVDVDDPGGTFALHFVFTNPAASPTENLFVFNFFEVQGVGVTGPPPVPDCDGTIIVGGSDSGVADRVTDDLWCASELLDDGRLWGNHGQLVSHVDAASERLVADGVPTPQERARIMRTVARS